MTNLIMQHPSSIMAYAVANGLLSPPIGMGEESIDAMLEGLIDIVNAIEESSKAYSQTYFPKGVLEIPEEHQSVCYVILFLINQVEMRGDKKKEMKNVGKLVKRNEALAAAYRHLVELFGETAKIFDTYRNIEVLQRLNKIKQYV